MYSKKFLDKHLTGAPSTTPTEDAGSWLVDALICVVCFAFIAAAFLVVR